MDTVPVDFIERAVFLLDDFSPLGELSYDSRFYTFFEQLSDKCYEESVLTCIRCEENRKYLRRVEFMLPDMIYIQGTTNNNHDNQELEKRVLSLCFFAKEVHLVICFNFALEFDVNYVKKFLQLNIPVHNVTLGYTRPEMECDSLIDQLLRNALARKSLRTVRVKYFKGSSWNFLDGMFGRAEFETLEWSESEDTFREYGWRYIVSQWTLGHISRSMFPYLHRVKRSAIEEADGSIVKINDFRLSSELIKKIKKQGGMISPYYVVYALYHRTRSDVAYIVAKIDDSDVHDSFSTVPLHVKGAHRNDRDVKGTPEFVEFAKSKIDLMDVKKVARLISYITMIFPPS
ncbi:hypothetical protein QR680_006975 [Steinernema hermaphroditum]|uniref:Uncharacterized protein n=1 Tax=Steinernema hermaphroditum TaxID=289476 RepID=A0AA39HYN6_9BILA|nr:hypothetical protein QR680_006975 [Steinernema hermaphroditum]